MNDQLLELINELEATLPAEEAQGHIASMINALEAVNTDADILNDLNAQWSRVNDRAHSEHLEASQNRNR